MTEYDGLKKRNLLGYFNSPPESYRRLRVLKPDGGLQLSFFEETITDQDDPFFITTQYVFINMPGKLRPIGYMKWNIFASRGNWISAEDFFLTCDNQTLALCNFAAAITKEQQIDVEVMFLEGAFAELDRIELRETYLGKGHGIAAIKSFIAKSLSRRRVHTIFMKPFPLQCESAAPDGDENQPAHTAYEKYAKKATKSLSMYYQRTLGAKPLSKRSKYLYVSLDQILAKQ